MQHKSIHILLEACQHILQGLATDMEAPPDDYQPFPSATYGQSARSGLSQLMRVHLKGPILCKKRLGSIVAVFRNAFCNWARTENTTLYGSQRRHQPNEPRIQCAERIR